MLHQDQHSNVYIYDREGERPVAMAPVTVSSWCRLAADKSKSGPDAAASPPSAVRAAYERCPILRQAPALRCGATGAGTGAHQDAVACFPAGLAGAHGGRRPAPRAPRAPAPLPTLVPRRPRAHRDAARGLGPPPACGGPCRPGAAQRRLPPCRSGPR